MTVLRPGDLVILKSGGPVMTVDAVNTDIFDDDKVTGVLCAWFVGNKLERARFDSNAIVPAPPQDVSSDQMEPQPSETAGEYKAVIDDMMAAMNDPTEAPDEASGAPLRKSRRASATKDAADSTAPARRGMN
jgi:uncharacterized protein YodC (DUF2158 family)